MLSTVKPGELLMSQAGGLITSLVSSLKRAHEVACVCRWTFTSVAHVGDLMNRGKRNTSNGEIFRHLLVWTGASDSPPMLLPMLRLLPPRRSTQTICASIWPAVSLSVYWVRLHLAA